MDYDHLRVGPILLICKINRYNSKMLLTVYCALGYRQQAEHTSVQTENIENGLILKYAAEYKQQHKFSKSRYCIAR